MENFEVIVLVGEVHIHSRDDLRIDGLRMPKSKETAEIAYIDGVVSVLRFPKESDFDNFSYSYKTDDLNWVCIKHPNLHTPYELRWCLGMDKITPKEFFTGTYEGGYKQFKLDWERYI